tara:strand:- start:100 stop:711 length:612 start_codon:yes stop_codon:yes gene_type:complete
MSKIFNNSSVLFVISGPSGVGKDALVSEVKKSVDNFHFAITATTRELRSEEQDGVDYLFLSKTQFEAMINSDDLLEWAIVYDNYYGVPKDQIRQGLSEGKDIILKTDVQGADTIKTKFPQSVSVFIAPESNEDLKFRLKKRSKGESLSNFDLRISEAKNEIEKSNFFDYIIINKENDLKSALKQFLKIVDTEKQLPRTEILLT